MICSGCEQDHGDVAWRFCPFCGEELLTESDYDETLREMWEGEDSPRAMRRSDPEGEDM